MAAEAGFESLEERVMLSALDLADVRIGTTPVWTAPVESGMPAAAQATASNGSVVSSAPPFPLSDTFNLHSLPGADLVIYLDFNGHVTTGTLWNLIEGLPTIVHPAYDIDGDPNFFSATEREFIQHVWQRVSEDFAPFTVDVTTEDPGIEGLRKTNAMDTKWGVRAVQTTDWGTGAGGIAIIGSFSRHEDDAVFAFNGSTGSSVLLETIAADTISHEVGHSLGLQHDGQFSQEYYGGHGFGPTGYVPIMGAGFINTPGATQQLSQWSQGEYPGATNMEDDLALITNPALGGGFYDIDDMGMFTGLSSYSGLTYKADDIGNTAATATPLLVGSSIWGPTFEGSGLIERNTDVDMFSFDWTGGALSITVTPFERGPNLDIEARIYDAMGNLLAISNPFFTLEATVNAFLNAGRYYLRVDGIGKLASGPDYGYSDYGSLGRYTISTPPPFEDRYENNDVRGQATDPLNNGGNWEGILLSDVNLPGRAQDEDWYLINVKPGQLRVRANLTFEDALGDLDLWLVDANGIPVAKAESVTDNEFIDVVVSAPGIYYLRVLPYANETGNFYNLEWFDDVPISTVNIAVSPSGASEDGTASLVFTFTRVLDIASSVTITFNVSGTAVFGSDYTVTGAKTFTGSTGSVTFAAGSSTATVVIDPTADTTVELDEDVTLTVVAGTGYELGSNVTATSTIRNDDQARVSINDVSVFEGNSGTTELTFTLTLDKAVDSTLLVFFNTADRNPISASSASDYTSVSDSLAFLGIAGEVQTITILVSGDLLQEPNEVFDLLLAGIMSNGRNVIRDRNRAVATILNDDAPPVAPTNVQASNNRGDHVAVTWNPVAGADSYDVYRATVDDFTSAASIATGVLVASFDDLTATAGVTYFYWVKAVNSFDSSPESTSDSGLLLPSVTIAVAPASIAEDASGTVVFTFTRSGSTGQELTVNVLVAGTARLGSDYSQVGMVETGTLRTVTFAAGSATATMTITPTADTAYELDETIVVRIVADAGYVPGAKTAAVTTITNDDSSRLGLVTSPAAGFEPKVIVYDATGQSVRFELAPYAKAFTRGVQVATGDVNHDGISDIVVGPASGVAPLKVYSGLDGKLLMSFLAYSDNFNADLKPTFAGGFSLAVGDVDGDGFADIVVAPLSGAGPFVRVFSGKTGGVLTTFKILENESFKGGLNIAVGDIDNDGKVELFATPASAAGPFVRIYNPQTGGFIRSFWALPDEVTGRFTGGLTVAAGDIDGDGRVEIITGIASQGGPAVRIFNASNGLKVNSFYAYSQGDREYFGGINVGVSDFNGDGKAEITVASRTLRSDIRIFNGLTSAMMTPVAAPYPTFDGGVFATGEVARPPAMGSSSTLLAQSAALSGSSGASSENGSGSSSDEPHFFATTSAHRFEDLFSDESQLEVLLTV